MKLSDNRLKNLKPKERPYRMADGEGLSIQIEPSGSKLWRFRYRIAGSEKMLSMGSYPEVGLAAARKRREEARALLAAGRDPSAHRLEEKAKATAPPPPTFKDVAQEFYEKAEREDAAPKTLAKLKWMLGFCYPEFGDHPIAEITAPQVLKALRVVEARGFYSSAPRVRSTVGQVFRYAIATGRAERDVAADLRGALTIKAGRHHPAVTDPKQIGGLIRAIRGHAGEPAVRAGLLIAAYTFLRPGEVRTLEWADYDRDAARITIPGERMKMKRAHIVPVSRQVAEVLAQVEPLSRGKKLILTGLRSGRPLSENTLNAALRTLGYDGETHVAHGFRTTASTLLNEGGWHPDWIERQLAHIEKNKVRRAYNAAEYIEGRTQMMQAYADLLDSFAGDSPG